eukprot:3068288-Heterocapsa_arctica.AAC.1
MAVLQARNVGCMNGEGDVQEMLATGFPGDWIPVWTCNIKDNDALMVAYCRFEVGQDRIRAVEWVESLSCRLAMNQGQAQRSLHPKGWRALYDQIAKVVAWCHCDRCNIPW